MIRVVIYLVVIGILAFAAVWLADRPGDVVITWQGRRIETSVMVLAGTGGDRDAWRCWSRSPCAPSCGRPTSRWLYLRTRRGGAAISRCRRA